jgi:hypothetical protein
MTVIGPSTWRTAHDCRGQSIDIRGRTMELLDGRSLTDYLDLRFRSGCLSIVEWLESQSIDVTANLSAAW